MERALADPAERQRLHIASEMPRVFDGRLAPGAAVGARVKLPDLAAAASALLAGGIEGREIEVLRSSLARPVPRVGGLQEPAAAVPRSDGLAAFVLERPRPGAW